LNFSFNATEVLIDVQDGPANTMGRNVLIC